MGNPDRPSHTTDRADISVPVSGAFSRATRIHQENANDAGRGNVDRAKTAKGINGTELTMSKKHMGSSIDDFLREEGRFEESQAQAIKEVVAWQLAEAMKKQKISKKKMATLLHTSRTQVDRLLDPKNDITLGSLQRAAGMVGRRVSIELV
jgi:predicted XRE-type DNA-binding protein